MFRKLSFLPNQSHLVSKSLTFTKFGKFCLDIYHPFPISSLRRIILKITVDVIFVVFLCPFFLSLFLKCIITLVFVYFKCLTVNIHRMPPRGACGVMVIVVGNEHGDTSSNPGRD